MNNLKNNLDEMQEQKLLQIEHNGCWLAFWALLLAIVVQIFFYGFTFKTIAGEWIIFMVLSVYLCVSCIRSGIWDRRIPMTAKSNLLASLIAGLAVGVFSLVFSLKQYGMGLGALAGAAIAAALTFVLCFLSLTIACRWTKKRQQALESEPGEETTEE